MLYSLLITSVLILVISVVYALMYHALMFKVHAHKKWLAVQYVIRATPQSTALRVSYVNTVEPINVMPRTGLRKDMDVYSHFLGTAPIVCCNLQKDCYCFRQGNLVLMLEHLVHTNGEDIVVFIPNQELLDNEDEFHLKHSANIRHVLCKTKYAADIMSTFRDRFDRPWSVLQFTFPPLVHDGKASIPKCRQLCFHPAGKSWMKNTSSVLSTWARHPGWPMLVVTCSAGCEKQHDVKKFTAASNILVVDFLESSQMDLLQSQAGYVVLPSACEGFGHSLYEAVGNASLVITTDAPPMNEFFTSTNSVLVDVAHENRLGDPAGMKYTRDLSSEFGSSGSACFGICEASLQDALVKAFAMSDTQFDAVRETAIVDWERKCESGMLSTKSALIHAGFSVPL